MKIIGRAALQQVAACLSCIAIVWRYESSLWGTEFSGGRITGILLGMKDAGSLLFVTALLLTFFYRRIAALITLIACALCLPLYLYFTIPSLFRKIFRAEWSVPLQAGFIWNNWTVAGIVVLAITASVAVRNLLFTADLGSRPTA
jgi:glycerol-3-phosphate acyltransferase PlsY